MSVTPIRKLVGLISTLIFPPVLRTRGCQVRELHATPTPRVPKMQVCSVVETPMNPHPLQAVKSSTLREIKCQQRDSLGIGPSPAQPSPTLHPLLVSSHVMRRMQGRPHLPGLRAGNSRPSSQSRVDGRVILGVGGVWVVVVLVKNVSGREGTLSRGNRHTTAKNRFDAGGGRQADRQPSCIDKGTCRGRWLRIAHAVAADTSHHTTPAWLAGWVAGPKPPTSC